MGRFTEAGLDAEASSSSQEGITHSGAGEIAVTTAFFAIWAMAVPVVLTTGYLTKNKGLIVLCALSAPLGMVLLAMMVRARMRARKFGVSTLVLATRPAVPGRELPERSGRGSMFRRASPSRRPSSAFACA